jgi:hypothetical protein
MEIVFFIVGLVFAAIGGYMLWDMRRFARTAVRGEGLVIGFAVNESRRGKSGSSPTYSPVIRYQYQGRDYEFTGRLGSSQVKRSIGDPVAVLISPDDPAQARVDSPGMWIFGGVLLALGLVSMTLFFLVFDFSLLSVGIAAAVIAALVSQAAMKLRRHDIHGVEDMKSALAGPGRKQPGPEASGEESRQIITDPKVFEDEHRKHKAPGWVLVLFLVVGLGVLVGGGFVAKERSDFLATARSATGEVVDFKRRTSTSDGKRKTTHYPIVRYQPPGHDAPVEFQHDTGSSSPSYSRGENVKVLYSPADPGKAIIDAGIMNWFGPGLMIVLGGAFTVIGGLTLRSRLAQRRRKPADVELDF